MPNPAARPWLACGELVLILAVLFIQAGWPVPDVNEPHYLSKAKHYWDPDWCGRDFFCTSADAHQVFYWTFGWLSKWLSLTALAWWGRALTWSLLAWAWRRLSWAVVPLPLYSVLTAGLFVTLNANCQMAGEWMVGGVEAKGFAYVLVLLGLERLVRRQWRAVWPLLGAAAAIHVIVGGWCVVAAGIAWLLEGKDRPTLRSQLPWLALGGIFSLPGLLPGVALTRNVDPAVVEQANYIYVFERLGHHLVFQRFPLAAVLRSVGLLALWGWLNWRMLPSSEVRPLRGFMIGAIAIALCGVGLSSLASIDSLLAAKLLRYYWFRLYDVGLPLCVALLCGAYIAQTRRAARIAGDFLVVVSMSVALVHLGSVMQWRHDQPGALADRDMEDRIDWQAICEWIDANTPQDAVFITPRLALTFRWYSNRAEVANRKDIPQDAAAIVEWWRRQTDLHLAKSGSGRRWRRSLTELSAEELTALGKKYGAGYVVTTNDQPLPLPRVSQPNRTYVVYRLPSAEDSSGDAAPEAADAR